MQEGIHQGMWQLATRVNYHREAIFKLKAINDDEFITHLPTKRVIATFDNNLQDLSKNHTFSQQIQAIEYFSFEGSTFVAAGTKQGLIELKNIEQDKKYQLSSPEAIQHQHTYINDMLYLGEGRLMNCYNNGKLAIWNLHSLSNDNLQPQVLKQVHSSFTYKLRRIDCQTVLTSSNDSYAKVVDLQTLTIVDSFPHEDGVWCAYPLNENIFCSGGLMNKLVFWDLRQKRIIGKCELQHEQVSFITRFDQNQIIFGDKKDVCTCDLRKPRKSLFGNTRMKSSVESIIVRPDSVIATGRGGDLCSFIYSDQPVNLEERSVGQPHGFLLANHLPHNLLEILQNFNNGHGLFNFINDGDQEDEDEDIFMLQPHQLDNHGQQQGIGEHQNQQLNEEEGQFVDLMQEDDDWEDIEENQEQGDQMDGNMEVESSEPSPSHQEPSEFSEKQSHKEEEQDKQ